jgi:tetratricopeptide (TPR) repeat protein
VTSGTDVGSDQLGHPQVVESELALDDVHELDPGLLGHLGPLLGAELPVTLDCGHAVETDRAAEHPGLTVDEHARAAESVLVLQEPRAIDSNHPDWAPNAATSLGTVRQQQGRLEEAATAYQRAIDSNHPGGPIAWVGLGEVRRKQGRLDEAATAYHRTIDSNHPGMAPFAATSLGDMRRKQGRLDEAATAYQRAIDSNHPDWAPVAADRLRSMK